jgi:hypothetical protein
MYHGELTNILVVVTLLILSSLSVFTNTWSVANIKYPDGSGSSESDLGLWKGCVQIKGPDGKVIPMPTSSQKVVRDMYPFSKNYTCVSADDDGKGYKSNTLTAVRAFAIAGMVLLLLAVVLIIAAPEHKGYFMISLMLGGLFSIVAAIIWTTDKDVNLTDDEKATGATEHYGYSWYLGLISGIFALLFSLLVHFNVIA